MELVVSRSPLAVTSVGMACCNGLSALSACAAIRAGVSRFEALAFHDARGEPIIGAPAVEVVEGKLGFDRVGPLLCAALADCMGDDQAEWGRILRTVPCLIVVGAVGRPDHPANINTRLLDELRAAFDVDDLHPQTRVACLGVAGFFSALSHARTLLAAGHDCLVVCVDSLLNRHMLASLERRRKLLTPDNSDGVVPGEAAAALWLIPARGSRVELAHIVGVGLAREPSVLDPELANKGTGLLQAIRNALSESGLPFQAMDFRVAGLTGERADFMEVSTAVARVQEVHKEEFVLWAPAEQIGDVGAALPACMAVVAIVGLVKRYAPGPRGLLLCVADDDQRGACIVARPGS